MGNGPKYKYNLDEFTAHAHRVCAEYKRTIMILHPFYTSIIPLIETTHFLLPYTVYEIMVHQMCREINRRRPPPKTHVHLRSLLRNFSSQNPLRTHYEILLRDIEDRTRNGLALVEELDYDDDDFKMIWEDLLTYELHLPRACSSTPMTPPSSPEDFRDYHFVEHFKL
jgi:hypothetical protein